MKVIAQSVVPTAAPYIHLGYLSASAADAFQAKASQGLVAVGFLLIAGALLMAHRTRATRSGESTEPPDRSRKALDVLLLVFIVAAGAVLTIAGLVPW